MLGVERGSRGLCPKGLYDSAQGEWHEDKDSLGWFFVPKGQEDSAQGFNPGNRISPAKSPEGAPDPRSHA